MSAWWKRMIERGYVATWVLIVATSAAYWALYQAGVLR